MTSRVCPWAGGSSLARRGLPGSGRRGAWCFGPTCGVRTGLQGRGFFGGGSLAWGAPALLGPGGDLVVGGGGRAGRGSRGRGGMGRGPGRRGWTMLMG